MSALHVDPRPLLAVQDVTVRFGGIVALVEVRPARHHQGRGPAAVGVCDLHRPQGALVARDGRCRDAGEVGRSHLVHDLAQPPGDVRPAGAEDHCGVVDPQSLAQLFTRLGG